MNGKIKCGNGWRLVVVGQMRMCARLTDARRELLCGLRGRLAIILITKTLVLISIVNWAVFEKFKLWER